MINEETLTQIAQLQLQAAVLRGEQWAIKQALGIGTGLAIGDGEGGKWEIEVVHVETTSKEKTNAEGKGIRKEIEEREEATEGLDKT